MMYGDPAIFGDLNDYVDLYKPMAEVEPNEDNEINSNKRKVKVEAPKEIKTVAKKTPEKEPVETQVQEVKPAETKEEAVTEEVPAPPKRKRGRPRKNPLPEETTKE